MRRTTWIVLTVAAVAVGGGAFLWAGGVVGDGGEDTVAFADVQQIFTNSCAGCHPVIVSSLDLTEGKSYAEIVGVRCDRGADPALRRRRQPRRLLPLPQGRGLARQPRQPHHRRAHALRQRGRWSRRSSTPSSRWIGTARSTRAVRGRWADGGPTTPGPARGPARRGAARRGCSPATAGIEGTITGADHQPIAGAVVAMLVVGWDLPGGEEHYLAGVARAPTGATPSTARRSDASRSRPTPPARPTCRGCSRRPPAPSPRATWGFRSRRSRCRRSPRRAGASRRRRSWSCRWTSRGPGWIATTLLAVNADSGRVFELGGGGGRGAGALEPHRSGRGPDRRAGRSWPSATRAPCRSS